MSMTLEEITRQIGARLQQQGRDAQAEITKACAADRMSTLLAQATDVTLLITSLANTQLAHVAELMDCPALCLVDGVEPDADLLAAASRGGSAVLVSPYGMFETSGRLYRCLYGGGDPAP